MSRIRTISVNVEGRRDVSWVYLSLFLVCSCSLFIKFFVDKHLSLDGVNYFFHVLENRDFANIAWSRRFTEYLTEWPLVFAVRLGVTKIPILVDIFAVGIYFPYLISFMLCWYIVRDQDRTLLWFPLAGYLAFNVLSDYDLIADHHVMAVMTWPILLLLLKTRPLIWVEGLLLWILLALYTRMYETAVVTSAALLFIALFRIFHFQEYREKIISGIALALLLMVMFIAVYYIAEPRSPINRGNFYDSILVNKRNWEAMATCGFMAIFCCGWLAPARWAKVKFILYLLSLAPIVIYIALRVTSDYAMTAYISFSSRTLSGVVIPGLIIFAGVVVGFKSRLTNIGTTIFAIVFLVMTAINVSDLRYWIEVKDTFKVIIRSGERFVSIDNTALKDSHYRWSWNNTLLSLVWSSPCVDTIVLNELGDPQGPVDPRTTLVLKRYLKYRDYFREIDADVTVCNSSETEN